MRVARLVAVLALLAGFAAALALGVSACGGDDEQGASGIEPITGAGSASGSNGSGETRDAQGGEKASGGSGSASGAQQPFLGGRGKRFDVKLSSEAEVKRAVGDLDALRRQTTRKAKELRKRNRKLPAADIEALKRKAVLAMAVDVLRFLGFDKSNVVVGPHGRDVLVRLDRRQACTARPRDAGVIMTRIKTRTSHIARRVRVRVGSVSLAKHLRERCGETAGGGVPRRPERGSPKQGGGTGKVVWQGTNAGTRKGIRKSPEFEIRGEEWTIYYENVGSTFQVFVYKDKELVGVPINEQSRGVGQKTVTGGPGKFSLLIGGTGIWRVSVRDGT